MTTISPAGTHRPSYLPLSADPLQSLKRVPSTSDIGKADDKPLRYSTEGSSAPKRQKLEHPTSASSLTGPSFNDPGFVSPITNKAPRAQDTKRLPLELVDGFFVGSEGTQDAHAQSPRSGRASPPQLPQRPWKHSLLARAKNDGTLSNPGVRKRSDMKVQTVPYKTEPPLDAPSFITDKIADFAPWLGNHPEDVLNDQTVKHGFVDRTPVSQNETNTARQSLYGLFKHRTGLQTLSFLFASVVEEREAHSKISLGSAYKPPPRVTLTEAKRKTWLSDLANPGVPLRKLSRTIPQGIRGQSLLDQCFTNNIPVGRALWFAKCVGANEIRTLKRKGASATFAVGAEIKWLRDWTINIEQFLESSIGHFKHADWRRRVNYALNLAIRFYLESLLDRDHYLAWIVKSLSTANLEQSPVWLLLVHLHKTDLIKYRKRGRLLTESLLEKFHNATELGHPSLGPLVARLKQILRSIVQESMACFIIPHSWRKYKSSVAMCLDLTTAPGSLLLEQLAHRNERLSTGSGLDSLELRTPRQRIIDILDSAKSPFNTSKITDECRSACGDIDLFVKVILEWCSSRFRTGAYRVYLAVHLLQLAHEAIDINSAVMDFLTWERIQTFCDISCIHLLVLELNRSRVFSLSRYLQWLTARGGLRYNSLLTASPSHSEQQKEMWEDLTRLNPGQILTAVPLSSLYPAVRNLRDILLHQAGFSLDQEASLIESCKGDLAARLQMIPTSATDPSLGPFVPDLCNLSWSEKSEVAISLKRHVVSLNAARRRSLTKDSGHADSSSLITDAEFRLIRSIYESLGDLSVLVAIIRLCITSVDEKLLASITDTVKFHLDAFSALGAFADLHSQLFRAYLSLRDHHGLPRQFIVSLISLGSIVSSNLLSVSSLQQDLARGDRNLSVAACSPVSDGMAESLQQAGPTFTEEFEAVLSSGNRMEGQTMAQLFNVLTERLEKGCYHTQAENDETLCALYARLRIYRPAQFDSLLAAWLQRLVTTVNSRSKQLLPILISTSCVTFGICVEIFVKVAQSTTQSNDEGFSMRTHLAGFLETINAAERDTNPIMYKMKLENARHVMESPEIALALRVVAGISDNENLSKVSNDLLVRLVLRRSISDMAPTTNQAEVVTPVLDNLLRLRGDGSIFAFHELVEKTTDLSMPFCRLRLQIWAATSSFAPLTEGPEEVVEILFDLAKSEAENAWMFYVTAVGPDAACRVREKAEEALFALPIFPTPGRSASTVAVSTCVEQASRYLKIVLRTAYSIPPLGVQSIIPILVDRFAVILRGLIAGKIVPNNDNSRQMTSQSALPNDDSTLGNIGHLTAYLGLLLQMTSIHRIAIVSSRTEPLSSPIVSPKQSQQDVVKMLALLTNIALHPFLENESVIVSHIFDVAASIVDDASDEVRALCARILKDKMRDQRVEYLFGCANSKATVPGHRNSQTGDMTGDLQVSKDSKRLGEYRFRNWEMLEGGVEASISLSLFDARREV